MCPFDERTTTQRLASEDCSLGMLYHVFSIPKNGLNTEPWMRLVHVRPGFPRPMHDVPMVQMTVR